MVKQAHLFVYGTLRRGFRHLMADLLAEQAEFVGEGVFQGRLYDLGSYPGVTASNHAGRHRCGRRLRLT